MSIRREIFLMLLIVIALYAGIDYATHRLVVSPSFLELERTEAIKDMQRSVAALKREIIDLDQFAAVWATRDDTYQFAVDRNQGYIDANLRRSTFVENKINLISLFDHSGKVVWSESFNIKPAEAIVPEEFSRELVLSDHSPVSHENNENSLAGVFTGNDSLMLVSSRSIVTSKHLGSMHGTLIMARLLDDSFVSGLSHQTKTSLKIQAKNSNQLADHYKQMVEENEPGAIILEESGQKTLKVFYIFPDLHGRSSVLLEIDIDREISERGHAAIRFAMWSLLGGGILVVVIFLSLLRVRMLEPLESLTRHVTALGRSDDLSARIKVEGNNELSALASEFNSMIEKLADARGKLIDQSYNSGMAEITSGVIHNIRNTVNPVIADIVLLREKTTDLPLKNMGKSVVELTSGPISAERSVKLKEYLEKSLALLESVMGELESKLNNMEERSQLIERLLSDLEKFAYSGGYLREKLNLFDLINDAVYLFQDRFKDNVTVDIDPSIEKIGFVETHKSAIMQVFINLFYNAGESILKAKARPGIVAMSAEKEEVHGRKMVHITICDNGVGIAPELLENIFERGYTTKDKKISGIGLHWCANTIFALRGKLYAESAGAGKGACLHLLIPEEI